MKFVSHQTITEFFDELVKSFSQPGNVYLTGESSLVYQRWQRWADRLEYCADVDDSHQQDFQRVVQNFMDKSGIAMLNESPEQVIPLPDGYKERALMITLPQKNGNMLTSLRFFHFDPYSISFRFIARGDETDYKMVINFLKNGWINLDKMGSLIEDLLPAFSFDTIQQDPAEFRRKYKGLLQMWDSYNVSNERPKINNPGPAQGM
jgi:hypothetical protein